MTASIGIAVECAKCGKVFVAPRPEMANGVPFKNVLREHLPKRCPDCVAPKRIWSKWSPERIRKQASRKNTTYICSFCEKPFDGRSRKYCTQKCREAAINAAREKKTYLKICIVCGKEFHAKNRETKVCGITCRRKRKAERDRHLVETHQCVRFPQSPSQLKRGTVAEILFDAFCVMYGIPCLSPVMDNQPAIDRVIWMNERWLSVQVRVASKSKSGSLPMANASTNLRNIEFIDLFAAVDLDTGYVRIVDRNSIAQFGDRIAMPRPCDVVEAGFLDDPWVSG